MKTVSGLVVIVLAFLLFIGYIMNIYKLCVSDFDTPLKNEVIRGVSLFIPPVAGVVGWIDIEDGKQPE